MVPKQNALHSSKKRPTSVSGMQASALADARVTTPISIVIACQPPATEKKQLVRAHGLSKVAHVSIGEGGSQDFLECFATLRTESI
jgi:hypothetical protein